MAATDNIIKFSDNVRKSLVSSVTMRRQTVTLTIYDTKRELDLTVEIDRAAVLALIQFWNREFNK